MIRVRNMTVYYAHLNADREASGCWPNHGTRFLQSAPCGAAFSAFKRSNV